MKKRIIAIICIMFLLFTATAPLSSGVFSYADTPTEELTDDEILNAALAVYLNARNGYITIADGTVEGAKALMNSTLESFLLTYYYTMHVTKLDVLAGIIIKYSPFRVSLKGSAVRAFNDLYDYLEDQGKVDNASNSDGGSTNDNLYDGKIYDSDTLFYVVHDDQVNVKAYNPSDIELGSHLPLLSTEQMLTYVNTNWPGWESKNLAWGGYININYPSDGNTSVSYRYQYGANTAGSTPAYLKYKPYLRFATFIAAAESVPTYMNSTITGEGITGQPCLIHFTGSSNPPCDVAGYVVYDAIVNQYYISSFRKYTSNTANTTSEEIDFETENFIKTPTTVPEGDNEIEYTPKDKITNNTYNTYNEYINNYVIKNTYINNNNSGGNDPEDPETPGGTTPPWDSSSGSGTITPDGNGGYNFNLPDLTIPDLNIDWSINGLKEKFPFSIPWDLLAFFTVLNAEPETPSITAQIDLGIVDWDIDWNLHQFDNIAALLRNLEFIGFCLALILITRSIIKG